jgi:hypothetical protein
MMCDWIASVWDMVSPEVITKHFLKAGISEALDGSEGDMLWIEGEDVNEEGVTNCSQGDTSEDDSSDK